VNAGISVSRVGGNAQIKAMRQVAGRLRLDLAQYRELAAFAQFASDLDKATRDQLTRGEKTSEILKQPQFEPLSVERQVAIIWTVTNGYLDDVETPKIREFETGLYRFLDSSYPDLLPAIAKERAISDELSEQLKKAVTDYRHQGGFGKTDEDAAGKADDKAKPEGGEAEEEPPAETEASAEGEATTAGAEASAEPETASAEADAAEPAPAKADAEENPKPRARKPPAKKPAAKKPAAARKPRAKATPRKGTDA
jgi:hypothetical protein